MTTQEIVREYKKIFILVIESAGEQLNNSSYKNVEELLSTDDVKRFEEDLDNCPRPLDTLIALYISVILVDIYENKISEWGDLIQRVECYSIYNNYLKAITDKFTKSVGLPTVDLNKMRLIIHERYK